MEALRKVDQKVGQLVGEAYAILAKKDQIFVILRQASSRAGEVTGPWMTETETADSYRLAREINGDYAAWYSSAWHLVRANLPERKSEFEALYDTCRSALMEIMTGDGQLRRMPSVVFEQSFSVQAGFLRSIPSAIESRALGLRGILSRDLMDDELSVARHLLDNGYDREAGVIAGVVLERHLKLLCEKYGEDVGDKDTLGQLNEKLKCHYPDLAEYKRIQFLNEIRTSCAHDKKALPEPDKISQLISGVQAFISAIV